MPKVILSLCDLTGTWSGPYDRDPDYEVIRIDLQTDGTDVRFLEHLKRPVYGILAAPPCTMFANSGARWVRTREEMLDALSVVDACLRAVAIYRPKFWALENPVGKLRRYLGDPTLIFDPYEYAGFAPLPQEEAYTKKTLLWGEFNLLEKSPVPPTLGSKMHLVSPGPNRANIRSKTPEGFALAFYNANR